MQRTMYSQNLRENQSNKRNGVRKYLDYDLLKQLVDLIDPIPTKVPYYSMFNNLALS